MNLIHPSVSSIRHASSLSMGLVVLAAGKGKRLLLPEPKPLVPLLGKRLMDFPLEALAKFTQDMNLRAQIGIVTGYRREEVEDHIAQNYPDFPLPIQFAHQSQQLGTADALRAYFQGLPWAKEMKYTLVICADTPLIRQHHLTNLYQYLQKDPELEGVAAAFKIKHPTGYGRIVREGKGFSIVEEKDADEEIRKIEEVNAGLYIFQTSFLLDQIGQIKNENKSGEYYLTDLCRPQFPIIAHVFEDSQSFLGVNDLAQLEEVEKLLRKEKIKSLQDKGVRFLDSSTVLVDWEVEIGLGSLVYPQVVLEGTVKIGERVVIEAGCVLKNSVLENQVEIKAHSYLEEVQVHQKASIGPFARLRPGTEVGEGSKIGNFVEIKKAKLEKNVKISHLSYVGDAEVGENSNLGCGFITCNYDGKNKHLSKIGKDTFIGSDCQLVAPVEIGDNSFIAAGSTITQSVPEGSFAIARSKQVTKVGAAKRFLK